jgi:hypothetical protein
MKPAIRHTAIFILAFIFVSVTIPASPRNPSRALTRSKQIVVLVYETNMGLRFDLEEGTYKGAEYRKADANYLLAELKLHEGRDCQIIEVIDDRVPLSAITEISEMAINAGFTDIRPFVYWHKTGRMAELQFGPPIKFTVSAETIERRTEKDK